MQLVIKLVFAISLLAIFEMPGFAQGPPLSRLQSIGESKYHEIKYKPLDQIYHIYVRLPDEYDSKRKYPTVYLLDGGTTFPMLAAYYSFLSFGEEVPEAIIVGVSYGSNNWGRENQRGRDFTAPAASRKTYGGAKNFSTFFRSTLFPLIEKNYSSDSSKRVIFGQSLGGQFALYAAQAETGMFFGHIAINPALHRNLDFFLETKPERGKGVRVYSASGSKDTPRFFEPAQKWVEHWKKRQDTDWKLKTEIMEGHTHMSAAPTAFRQGLKWVFAKEVK